MQQERIARPRWLLPGLAAAALVALLGGTAAAQQPTPTAPAATGQPTDQTNGATQDDAPDPKLNGSVTAPTEQQGVDDDQEDAQLREMSGLISEQDAIAAATANGGTAGAASLDDEDGYVVYEVDVTNSDGTVNELLVDAGNGNVLMSEADDNDADDNDADDDNDDDDDDDDDAVGTPQGTGTAPQSDTAPQG